MYELKKTYSYDDVTLVPHYSDLKSRGETNPSMFGFDLPIIMSPMDTVTTPDMIRLFVYNNLVATVHRAFKTAEEQFNYVVDSKNRSETKDEIDKIVKGTWFSVGSIWKYKEWIDYLYNHGVVNFLVDMAHGDSLACIETVDYIRKLKNVNHIIAGNVATKSGFRHLQDAGANGIRIGIASGCFTPNMKVKTINGSKTIKNIEVGDIVLTHKNNWKKVINKLEFYKNEKLIKINGKESTKNHEYLVINKKYKDIVNEKNYLDYAEWIPASKLTKDHLLVEL